MWRLAAAWRITVWLLKGARIEGQPFTEHLGHRPWLCRWLTITGAWQHHKSIAAYRRGEWVTTEELLADIERRKKAPEPEDTP